MELVYPGNLVIRRSTEELLLSLLLRLTIQNETNIAYEPEYFEAASVHIQKEWIKFIIGFKDTDKRKFTQKEAKIKNLSKNMLNRKIELLILEFMIKHELDTNSILFNVIEKEQILVVLIKKEQLDFFYKYFDCFSGLNPQK